ncbi:hypothetical protein [Deinococcus aetherius]|uniref:hypothetical protein n=1 Tax=Deinococcus aetherius TaxID=200252 RepID=UPI0031EC2CB7
MFQGLREAAATLFWPSVTGTVLPSTGETGGSLFTPRVTYRYEVNGAAREGHLLSLSEWSSSNEAWARSVSGRYPGRARTRRRGGRVGLAPAAGGGGAGRRGPAAHEGPS